MTTTAHTHDDAPAREQEDDQVERIDEDNAVQEFIDDQEVNLGNSLKHFVDSVNKSTTELTEPALIAFHQKMLAELNAKVDTLRDLRKQNLELDTKLLAVHNIAANFSNCVIQTIDGAEPPQDQPMAEGDDAGEAAVVPEAEPDTVAADDAGSVGVAAGEDEDAPTGDQSHVVPVEEDGKRALEEEESAEQPSASPSGSPEKPPPADAASEGDTGAADKSSPKRQRRTSRKSPNAATATAATAK
tara:strand:- start:241 stop:972 length:732 start_codon:yes stop_codon:yes gene_type:complete